MTASIENQPKSGQTRADQAGTGPWAVPGPDVKWWRGATPDDLDEPPRPARRPSPRRRLATAATAPIAATAAIAAGELVAATAPIAATGATAAIAAGELVAATASIAATGATAAIAAGELVAVGQPAAGRVRRGRPSPRCRASRHPLFGLVALVLFSLLAVFFARVSAEPFWLFLGHGTPGTATVASCQVHGITKRCADFTADQNAFTVEKVALLGTGPVAPGQQIPARMVSATGSAAYSGSLPLRWATGLLGILLCGLAIAWLTGVYRLPRRRTRLGALGLCMAGPILLAAGVLAAAW